MPAMQMPRPALGRAFRAILVICTLSAILSSTQAIFTTNPSPTATSPGSQDFGHGQGGGKGSSGSGAGSGSGDSSTPSEPDTTVGTNSTGTNTNTGTNTGTGTSSSSNSTATSSSGGGSSSATTPSGGTVSTNDTAAFPSSPSSAGGGTSGDSGADSTTPGTNTNQGGANDGTGNGDSSSGASGNGNTATTTVSPGDSGGTAMATPAPTAAPVKEITLQQPPFVDTYQRGGRLEVRWTTKNIASNAQMGIELRPPEQGTSTETFQALKWAKATLNDQFEAIRLPSTLKGASQCCYTLYVYLEDEPHVQGSLNLQISPASPTLDTPEDGSAGGEGTAADAAGEWSEVIVPRETSPPQASGNYQDGNGDGEGQSRGRMLPVLLAVLTGLCIAGIILGILYHRRRQRKAVLPPPTLYPVVLPAAHSPPVAMALPVMNTQYMPARGAVVVPPRRTVTYMR